MRHIDLYIANDGKEFHDEAECALYEFGLKANEGQFKNRINFYGEDGSPIDILDPIQYADVHCIIPHDENIVEEYRQANEDCKLSFCFDYMPECMYHCDNRMGIFVYSEEIDDWENLEEKLKQIQNKLEFWKSR